MRARAALVRQSPPGAVGLRPQQICTVLAATTGPHCCHRHLVTPQHPERGRALRSAIAARRNYFNTGHQYCKHSVILPSPKRAKLCEKLRKRHHIQALAALHS